MTHPMLEGAFAPLTEEVTLTDLPVLGELPKHLDGKYLRNGPNPIGEIAPDLYNWFVGDGMVHGLRIRDGRAEWYRNRWVRSPSATRALHERTPKGRIRVSDIGANTNAIGYGGKILALVEAGVANYELNDELDTVGICDFDGTLTGGYTAHPKFDPATGELHAVSYSMNRGNTVQYSIIGVDGRARKAIDIEVSGSPMMHDFSLTEKHVIFYDLPVTFDASVATEMTVPKMLSLPARLLLSAFIGRVKIPDPISALFPLPKDGDRRFPYSWDDKYPARVGVMPRAGGSADIRWFDVEPCYVFHPANAYDSGDTVVLDVIRHPRIFDRNKLVPSEGVPTLDRWTVDLADGKVRESRIDDRGQEFPRVDERLLGSRHRFAYAPLLGGDAMSSSDTLVKHDLVHNATITRSFGTGKSLGEFVFQPASADSAEDDGVLMGYVHDAASDRSALAILDAQTLDDVATVQLPHRVPVGFHGNWVPS